MVHKHHSPDAANDTGGLCSLGAASSGTGKIGRCQHKEEIIRLDGLFSFYADGNGLHPTLAVPSLNARRISTAAPTPARCIRHRRRSQALLIPNTAVKLTRADNTWLEAAR